MFKIGQKVFDRATQRWCYIADTCLADSDSGPFVIYVLDSSIPEDEDFPHRHRLASEVSLTEAPPLSRVFEHSYEGIRPVKVH
jgi:hypothetical protein